MLANKIQTSTCFHFSITELTSKCSEASFSCGFRGWDSGPYAMWQVFRDWAIFSDCFIDFFNQFLHLLMIEFGEFFAYFGQLAFIRCLFQMFAHIWIVFSFSACCLSEREKNISYFFHEFWVWCWIASYCQTHIINVDNIECFCPWTLNSFLLI